MKKYKSIHMFVFLICIAAYLGIPQTIFADSLHIAWSDGQTETAMTVEAGAQFYMGDFVEIMGEGTHSTASISGANYQSSNKKIALINKKGYVKAKKEGLSEIRVVCKGTTLTCQLTVEPKKSIEKTKESKSLAAAAKKLGKKMPKKKLTAKNAYAFVKKYRAFLQTFKDDAVTRLAYDGFLYENERLGSGDLDESRSEVLAVPEASRFWTAYALVRQYQLENDPVSKGSKQAFTIKKAAASSKTGKITVELTKKISPQQILAVQLAFPEINSIAENKNKANLRVSIYDEQKRAYYIGKAEIKKGSKNMTIQPEIFDGFMSKDAVLTEGSVYRIGSSEDWAGGIQVTAKAIKEKKKKK